jgi:methanogen homoisocitrate dehydrogenase
VSSKCSKRVALIKGDGIGPEVIDSALKVLEAVGSDLDMVPFEVGYGRWKRTGEAMADEDFEEIKSFGCILFGAITSPKDPKYRSVLLRLRKGLDLYANIRPIRGKGLDFVIVRENTEGLYSGLEEISEDEARTVRVITRKGSERIARKACDICLDRGPGRRKLTIVHKANVIKGDNLFVAACHDEAAARGLEFEDMHVDAAAYNMVLHPEKFDVLVTTNLFGDILSDEAAGILGSLGLCASANLGDRYALFEPIHGSALDIAGKGIANPIGAIKSAARMLEWLGFPEKARLIEEAIDKSLKDGVTTPDLGGGLRTEDVTSAVIRHLEG